MTATLANNEIRQLLLANRKKEKEVIFENYIDSYYTITDVPHVKYTHSIGPDGEKTYLQATTMYKIDKLLEFMKKEGIRTLSYSFEI